MPPETKPVISSLAEMTCENCVYSGYTPEKEHSIWCFIDRVYQQHDSRLFCSKGKWLCNVSRWPYQDTSAPWVTDYDECYYLFGRGK